MRTLTCTFACDKKRLLANFVSSNKTLVCSLVSKTNSKKAIYTVEEFATIMDQAKIEYISIRIIIRDSSALRS